MKITRRNIIKATGIAVVCGQAIPFSAAQAVSSRTIELQAEEQIVKWFKDDIETKIWGYDLPVIRLKQFESVAIELQNMLPEPTTVHWHGMKVDNDMDGVSGLTQEPVSPGERFTYQLTPKDAGTYWAHAHHQTYRQLALGLYTPIIVEESVPYPVDQDLLFVVDDWLINSEQQLDTATFEDAHSWSHAGRMGNMLTINRVQTPEFSVKAGERIRLRLMNTANSRIMNFGFDGLRSEIVAKDGQPLISPVLSPNSLTIAPAERYDLVIDIPKDWQGLYPIYELSGKQPYLAAKWFVDGSANSSLATSKLSPLPANPVPLQNFKIHHKLTLNMQGGAMGNLKAAYYQGEKLSVNELLENAQAWTLNGVANLPSEPLATVKVGQGVEIKITNGTRWPHAMHLHGHHFYSENSMIESTVLQDTTLVNQRDIKTIQFLADTPGKWLIHCHMIEHQVSGMVTFIEVTA